MYNITIQVDQKTHDLLETVNESYVRDGVAREAERLIAGSIAENYERDADGNYHRVGVLQEFAG